MLVKIITALCFCFFYWFCCFLGTGTDRKNLVGLRSYPDAVQQTVREHPVLGKAAPQEKSIVSILVGNLLLFTIVFSVLGLALKNFLGLNEFWTAFWFFLALGEGLGLFDLVVIDLLWWRNTKRIRFFLFAGKGTLSKPRQAHRLLPAGYPAVCCGGGAGCRNRNSNRIKNISRQMERKKQIGLESKPQNRYNYCESRKKRLSLVNMS